MKHHALLLTPLLFALPAFASAKPSDGYTISTNNTCKVYPNQYIPYRQVKWSGDCKDGFAEGYGTATWTYQRQLNCGYTVTGTYRQGKLHGQATAQALDLKDEIQIMTADYQDGVAVGYQKILFDNGDIYEGEPQSNTNIYRGKYTFGKGEFLGDRYEGEWQHDQRTGKGKYFSANGDYYEGDFVNNSMHGTGVMLYANGNRYEGEWQNNYFHGQGKFFYAEGGSYEGGWQYNLKHGKGKLNYTNGEIYEGDFVDDERHGQGKFFYTDGAVYEGDFWQDEMTGKGTHTQTNSIHYTGSLIDGRSFGFGTRTIPKSAYADKPRSPLGHWQGDVFVEQGWFYNNKITFVCKSETHCRQLAKNNAGWQKMVREYDEIFEELTK
ncbi:MORN repeat-containing protein [Moraxella sp.]|uniref:MORN repeat-containing protein n=1 Tax=Moraxella sp. TaxID=479 RepID=UPI0026DCC5BA|nr:hypothetical protein [Moraxella sp.]MDO4894475.1 hypothetical protein [Moraxella sp.]